MGGKVTLHQLTLQMSGLLSLAGLGLLSQEAQASAEIPTPTPDLGLGETLALAPHALDTPEPSAQPTAPEVDNLDPQPAWALASDETAMTAAPIAPSEPVEIAPPIAAALLTAPGEVPLAAVETDLTGDFAAVSLEATEIKLEPAAGPPHAQFSDLGAVSGSSILPLGSSPLGEERIIESTTPNATVNRATGEVLLTAAAQQSLNQSAGSVLQGLEVNHPALASLITTPGTIDLDSLSLATTLAIADEIVEPEETIGQLAERAAAAINADNRFSLNGDLGSLGFEPPSTDPGTTSAVFIPIGGTPLVIPLSGSRSQIANTAAFLAAAFASGISPLQANLFTSFALAGVDYRSLVPLFNAVGGLMPKVVGGQQPLGLEAIAVDATQMESAIQAYNAILAGSDAATLAALAQNSDFVALGRSLQQLRAAID